MDDLDKMIKDTLNKRATSNMYKKTIEDTIEMIRNDERMVEEKVKFKNRFLKLVQATAVIVVIGVLGITTYAAVNGRLNINIGKTGNKKIDENYNDVATSVNKCFENDYFILTLESMAADPAYLIYEYNLTIKDLGMEKIGEVAYDEFDGYDINLQSKLYINGEKNNASSDCKTIEKISENKFRFIKIINIANVREKVLSVEQKLISLRICGGEVTKRLDVDIGQNVMANVIFSDREDKVLAETVLSDGSTLYIEEVANSKFENFVLARIISKPQTGKEMRNHNKEFMIEDPQFAICDQNDKTINYDFIRLEEYYEKILDDESVEDCDLRDLKDTDLVRMQQVRLIKLGFDEGEFPKKLKILPVNRKLYNDRNYSEEKFYNNEDWYQVSAGNVSITEDSQIGGSVTVTKIEEVDDKIIFYYDKQGYVPSYIDFVLRVKSEQMNYVAPRADKYKNIDDDENKIIYTKDNYMLAGSPLLGYKRFDNLDELEFAMFYNVKYDILSEPLEFSWNANESKEAAVIENVRFVEFVIDVNDELDRGDFAEGVISSVDEKYLKFGAELYERELIISNPKNYKYCNYRTGDYMDLEEVEPGDYFVSNGYEKNVFYIIKNVYGEELRIELLKQMKNLFKYERYSNVDDIEVVESNIAMVRFELSDFCLDSNICGYDFENAKSFDFYGIVNENTEIVKVSSKTGYEQVINVSDLKNIEYLNCDLIEFDESTIENENIVVTKLRLFC